MKIYEKEHPNRRKEKIVNRNKNNLCKRAVGGGNAKSVTLRITAVHKRVKINICVDKIEGDDTLTYVYH